MRDMNATAEEIAVSLQLDPDQVERHFSVCVPKIAGIDDLDNPAGASDAQLALLLQHSLELYHAAGLMGNMVAASSALAVRLRCLTEIGRRAETREKRAGVLDGVDPTSPMSSWPPELAAFWSAWMDDMLLRIAAAKEQEEVNLEQA